MNRLKHSISGYLRTMQMSRAQVFVFVEGEIDTYFYGKVAESVCQSVGISYTICKAQELPGGSGGKTTLIIWFRLLRRRSALIDSFKGKTTGSIFFLDKDVDDFLRIQCRSDHVVYTRYYDVENHIFREGDLGEAVAVVASIDHQLVLTHISSYEDWRRSVAEYWKDWVKLCLFARKRDIEGECNYSVWSRINNPLHGPVNPIAYTQRLKLLEFKSGLSGMQFTRAFRRISKVVDDIYARGEYDCVFKGKWYAPLLIEHIKAITGTKPQHSQALPDLLPKFVALTLDFSTSWAEYFKEPLRRLIHLL